MKSHLNKVRLLVPHILLIRLIILIFFNWLLRLLLKGVVVTFFLLLWGFAGGTSGGSGLCGLLTLLQDPIPNSSKGVHVLVYATLGSASSAVHCKAQKGRPVNCCGLHFELGLGLDRFDENHFYAIV